MKSQKFVARYIPNLKTTICTTLILFSAIQCIAQDWPNLAKYKEANAQLKPPSSKEIRIVFMGNSITEGWSQEALDFFDNPSYINRGISGQTTPQMLIRLRPDVIDLEPKVVVILAGINDIAMNTGPTTIKMIMDNLKSMCEQAKANNIKVILSSVLPANSFPWRPELKPADEVIELNKRIKSYADEEGITYINYFDEMVDAQKGLKSELTYDGVHPNVPGYKVMETLVEKAILKATN